MLEIWIKRAPGALAVASALALISSAIHEWAYFEVIGIRCLPLLTPSDYILTAVLWPPLIVVGLVLTMLFLRMLNTAVTKLDDYGSRAQSRLGISFGKVVENVLVYGGIIATAVFTFLEASSIMFLFLYL